MDHKRFISLVVEELSGQLTAAEQKELSNLLLCNKRLQAEYLLFKQYWSRKESHALQDEKSFQKVLQKIDLIERQTVYAPQRLPYRKIYLSIAASFFILIGTVFWFSYNQKSPTRKIYTGTHHRSVTLADGTKIVLNAASKLTYSNAFNEKNREVTLVGEGFFDVKKDPEHPFIIHTEQATIRVLGTTFNLKAYPKDVKTEASLLTGSLEVLLKNSKNQRIVLKPKQKLIITKSEKSVMRRSLSPVIELANISYASQRDSNVVETLWLENKLAFRNESFENIAMELERRYGVKFVFEEEEAKSLRFDAVFKQEGIDQILKALKIAAPFSYQINGNTVTIYK